MEDPTRLGRRTPSTIVWQAAAQHPAQKGTLLLACLRFASFLPRLLACSPQDCDGAASLAITDTAARAGRAATPAQSLWIQGGRAAGRAYKAPAPRHRGPFPEAPRLAARAADALPHAINRTETTIVEPVIERWLNSTLAVPAGLSGRVQSRGPCRIHRHPDHRTAVGSADVGRTWAPDRSPLRASPARLPRPVWSGSRRCSPCCVVCWEGSR